jgi:hypothetical protein
MTASKIEEKAMAAANSAYDNAGGFDKANRADFEATLEGMFGSNDEAAEAIIAEAMRIFDLDHGMSYGD